MTVGFRVTRLPGLIESEQLHRGRIRGRGAVQRLPSGSTVTLGSAEVSYRRQGLRLGRKAWRGEGRTDEGPPVPRGEPVPATFGARPPAGCGSGAEEEQLHTTDQPSGEVTDRERWRNVELYRPEVIELSWWRSKGNPDYQGFRQQPPPATRITAGRAITPSVSSIHAGSPAESEPAHHMTRRCGVSTVSSFLSWLYCSSNIAALLS
jgi:hypothetical protein